jgi:hypothetical protein
MKTITAKLIHNKPGFCFYFEKGDFHVTLNQAFHLLESSIFINGEFLSRPENTDTRNYLNETLEDCRELFNDNDGLKNKENALEFFFDSMTPALDCFSPKDYEFGLDVSELLLGYWKA